MSIFDNIKSLVNKIGKKDGTGVGPAQAAAGSATGPVAGASQDASNNPAVTPAQNAGLTPGAASAQGSAAIPENSGVSEAGAGQSSLQMPQAPQAPQMPQSSQMPQAPQMQPGQTPPTQSSQTPQPQTSATPPQSAGGQGTSFVSKVGGMFSSFSNKESSQPAAPQVSVAHEQQMGAVASAGQDKTIVTRRPDDKVIAIDGMGGDAGPEAVMKGIGRFMLPGFHFIVFGDQNQLSQFRGFIPGHVSYEIRHTDVAIASDMDVMTALHQGKSSSMGLALESVKIGEAQAAISSGNTGAYMALAKIILKTIEGIDRPAIASVIPGENGKSVCLDLGANAESTVKNLVDFAILGEAVAASIFHKNDVSVSLMNIGSEDIKGSRLVKKTAEILKTVLDNYVGYVEGDALCKGEVDVIVMDGFTGNIALKAIEGAAKYLAHELKTALGAGGALLKMATTLGAHGLHNLKDKMDPRLYNGAILAGLNGVVVKSHGASDEVAFENAIKFTANTLNKNIFTRISEHINKTKAAGALSSINSVDEKGQR